jgi:hypothetical protein
MKESMKGENINIGKRRRNQKYQSKRKYQRERLIIENNVAEWK